MSLDQLIRARVRRGAPRPAASVVLPTVAQVSLLPLEVRTHERAMQTRRGLIGGVVVAAVIAAAATGISATVAANGQARVTSETARLVAANQRLTQFSDVVGLQQRIADRRVAVRVGASTEIDWQRQIGLIQADMPAGFTVTAVRANSASPITDFTQGATSADPVRAASIQVTAETASIQDLPRWLRTLKSLPAYAGQTAAVSRGLPDGNGFQAYTLDLQVFLTPDVYVTPLTKKAAE